MLGRYVAAGGLKSPRRSPYIIAYCLLRYSDSLSNLVGYTACTGVSLGRFLLGLGRGSCSTGKTAFLSEVQYAATVEGLSTVAIDPATETLKFTKKWRDGSLILLIELMIGFRCPTIFSSEKESKTIAVPAVFTTLMSPVLSSTLRSCCFIGTYSSGTAMTHCGHTCQGCISAKRLKSHSREF